MSLCKRRKLSLNSHRRFKGKHVSLYLSFYLRNTRQWVYFVLENDLLKSFKSRYLKNPRNQTHERFKSFTKEYYPPSLLTRIYVFFYLKYAVSPYNLTIFLFSSQYLFLFETSPWKIKCYWTSSSKIIWI